MGIKRAAYKTPDDLIERCQQLYATGLTYQEVWRKMTEEGIDIGYNVVRDACEKAEPQVEENDENDEKETRNLAREARKRVLETVIKMTEAIKMQACAGNVRGVHINHLATLLKEVDRIKRLSRGTPTSRQERVVVQEDPALAELLKRGKLGNQTIN